MRFTTLFCTMLAILCTSFVVFTAVGFAADNDPVTVSGILDAAGCPLDDAQQKTLDEIDPDDGMMGLMMGLGDLFTDQQVDALIAKLGEYQRQGGMGGGDGETPVAMRVQNLMQVITFEKDNVPITEGQVAKFKSIEPGANMMQAMQDIYTPEQSAAMQKLFGGGGTPHPPGGLRW